MKKLNILFTAILLLLTAPISAQERETIDNFTSSWWHAATQVSQSCNGGVCTFVFQGTGAVNIMGAVTWTATVVQDFNVTPCNTWLAETTFAGANGSITISDACGVLCPGVGVGSPNTIDSVWNVTGGTGDFIGIAGSGTFHGNQNPFGLVFLNGHAAGVVTLPSRR